LRCVSPRIGFIYVVITTSIAAFLGNRFFGMEIQEKFPEFSGDTESYVQRNQKESAISATTDGVVVFVISNFVAAEQE